jgi:hypothetical protein
MEIIKLGGLMVRITYEKACEMSYLKSSYGRLETVLFLYSKMQRDEWLTLLGEMWSICDNIAAHRLSLRRIIGTVGPVREMMNEAEQAAYDVLPDTITVFRGCGPNNMLGASWTTDRRVAAGFPFLNRYFVATDPILITGRVKKKNILAIKLDREEYEIITFSARRVAVEQLHAVCRDFATKLVHT